MLNSFLVRDSFFSKALNHSHFLHLVSVLHKMGGWGREGRSLQNRQIAHVYPHLKEKQTKTIIATLSWTGNLDSSTRLSGEYWRQENVLPWATSRCPRVMLCCSQHTCSCAVLCFSMLCSLSLQLEVFLSLLLGFSVRQESSWSVGKLVFSPCWWCRWDRASKYPLSSPGTTAGSVTSGSCSDGICSVEMKFRMEAPLKA